MKTTSKTRFTAPINPDLVVDGLALSKPAGMQANGVAKSTACSNPS
ncbi:MAG: hypothetical protein ACTSUE_14965 [Promethearchaeota archaeon]